MFDFLFVFVSLLFLPVSVGWEEEAQSQKKQKIILPLPAVLPPRHYPCDFPVFPPPELQLRPLWEGRSHSHHSDWRVLCLSSRTHAIPLPTPNISLPFFCLDVLPFRYIMLMDHPSSAPLQQRDRSRSPRRRSPDHRDRARSPRSPRQRRRSYSPRSRSRSRDDYRRRSSRSPMSGSGHPGYSGPGYAGSGGAGGPRRSYEERAAAKDAMMQSLRDSSQQDRRVYVGNLSYDVKWHHLKDFMRQGVFKFSPFHIFLHYPIVCPRSTIFVPDNVGMGDLATNH